jgi:hypothetical protein
MTTPRATMMSRQARLLATLASIAMLLVSALIAVPGDVLAGTECGEWRWPVKTLSDRDRRQVDFRTRATTVRTLRSLHAPDSLNADTPRHGLVERRTYRVEAQVVAARIVEDSDVHLVIAVRGHRKQTMIVEFPHPNCMASPFRRAQTTSARRAVLNGCGSLSSEFTDLRGRVQVRGVAFWDDIDGQRGIAPNGIELHPVLGFEGHCRQV